MQSINDIYNIKNEEKGEKCRKTKKKKKMWFTLDLNLRSYKIQKSEPNALTTELKYFGLQR